MFAALSLTSIILAQSTLPTELPPIPEAMRPVETLKPLAFLAGRWIALNPNGTLNEEHWTAPRGNNMVGTFRQLRRDGTPSFVEVSLLSVEREGVRLRLRHLHRGLEVPEARKDPSDFFLKASGKDWVEFAGAGGTDGVVSVVYRLAGRDRLVTEVRFKPESGARDYTSVYFREGSRAARSSI